MKNFFAGLSWFNYAVAAAVNAGVIYMIIVR